MLQLTAQVIQQRLPLFPGKMRDLAALGIQEQVQAFYGGGFDILFLSRIPELFDITLVAFFNALLDPIRFSFLGL